MYALQTPRGTKISVKRIDDYHSEWVLRSEAGEVNQSGESLPTGRSDGAEASVVLASPAYRGTG